MAGYMTLGDDKSTMLPMLLLYFLSQVDEFPTGIQEVVPENYIFHPEFFGPNGDADMDGFTNKQEYQYFVPRGGKAAYVGAALDPNIRPSWDCVNDTATEYAVQERQSFGLVVPDPVAPHSTYQWYKDGQPLNDSGYFTGTHTRNLEILSVRLEDAGTYECLYDSGNDKTANDFFGPVNLVVTEAPPVPVAGGLGLAALALAATLGGARTLRRKK
jgi:hypothetical protein